MRSLGPIAVAVLRVMAAASLRPGLRTQRLVARRQAEAESAEAHGRTGLIEGDLFKPISHTSRVDHAESSLRRDFAPWYESLVTFLPPS